MAANPLASPWLKLERAGEHLVELDQRVQRFLEGHPLSTIGPDLEVNGAEHVYRLHVSCPPPVELSIVVGDVLHNLRSALDHMVYAWVCNQKPTLTDNEMRKLQFPIVGSPAAFRDQLQKGRLGGVQDSAFIERLQPYYGGEKHRLAVLRDLSNIDKHRRIATLVSATEQGRVSVPSWAPEPRRLWNGNPLEPQAEVLRLVFASPQPQMDVDLSVKWAICVEPVASVHALLVPDDLRSILRYIESAVRDEFARRF